MIELSPQRIAAEIGADVVATGTDGRPRAAVIDSRAVAPGDVFFGLRGEHADGARFAPDALAAGAWGVVVGRAAGRALAADAGTATGGWILAVPDPLAALQQLARAWRRELGARVVGITGSTGKTSVKDICDALLPFRVHASPANYNTEIGLPLTVLSAEPETEVLVLEMAMRGTGQIAELCEIAEPDVAAITNIGPVHLELLGTLEAIAEAKAEILIGLREGGMAVIPAGEEALEPHLSDELPTLTFGGGGDVFAASAETVPGKAGVAGRLRARVVTPAGEADFDFPFDEAHNLANALCAIAIGVALGAPVAELARRAPEIAFSRLRGELVELADGIVLVNDCYNANPVSMAAALEHLAAMPAPARRVAVLGEMAELGPGGPGYHRDIAAHARGLGIEPIVGVGELAREYAPDRWAEDAAGAVAILRETLRRGDLVLVKGSRSVGLERVAEELERWLPE